MADDDNFDIDIYGDDTSPDFQQDTTQQGGEVKQEDATTEMQTDAHFEEPTNTNGQAQAESGGQEAQQADAHVDTRNSSVDNGTQQISTTDTSSTNQAQLPKQAPKQQGMKRKQGEDDSRPLDPGASSALLINDLNWWINEEDVRGWANQSGCEDELVEVTFNEHKVNGKSKGQVYVSMQSAQAATALKHQLESYYQDQHHTKKPTVVFNPPHINPYKTLPKDVPSRDKNRQDNRASGNFNQNQNASQNNFNQNRFNNRNNFNRGGMNNNFGNRNFSSPSNMNVGGYGGGGPMNNFGGGAMGGMNNFNNNFGGRGGNMMGGMRGGMPNRGGRGGMMGNMGGMGMGGNMGMGMGGMGMGMGGMGGNMGMMGGMGPGGFGGNAQPHFNPAFFPNNQGGGGDGNWNPHGAKRTRQE